MNDIAVQSSPGKPVEKVPGIGRGMNRNSAVELLKLFSMAFIVFSHSVPDQSPATLPGTIDINLATSNPALLTVLIIKNLCWTANLVFIVTSMWYMAESRAVKANKVTAMVCDAVFISLMWLAVGLAMGYRLGTMEFIMQFFPVTSSVTWYLTCYIIFYLIHPLLIMITDRITQKTHLLICMILIIAYFGVDYVMQGSYYYCTALVIFIALFFIVSYIKCYMPETADKTSFNIWMIVIGLLGIVGMMLLTNFLGLHVEKLANQMGRWSHVQNPFLFMLAFGLFGLCRTHPFHNRLINYLSSLTLLMYIIHCSHMMRKYIRFDYTEYMTVHYGEEHWLQYILLFFVINLFGSMLLAVVYDKLLKKPIHFIAGIISRAIGWLYRKLETVVLSLR